MRGQHGLFDINIKHIINTFSAWGLLYIFSKNNHRNDEWPLDQYSPSLLRAVRDERQSYYDNDC